MGGVGDEGKDGLRLLHTALALNADSLYLVLNIRLPPNPQANLYLALSFTASKYTLALKGDCLPIEPGVVTESSWVELRGPSRAVWPALSCAQLVPQVQQNGFHLGFGSVE